MSNRLSDRLSAAAPYLRLPALSPILAQPSQAVDTSTDVLAFKLCIEEKDLTASSFSGRDGQAMSVRPVIHLPGCLFCFLLCVRKLRWVLGVGKDPALKQILFGSGVREVSLDPLTHGRLLIRNLYARFPPSRTQPTSPAMVSVGSYQLCTQAGLS